MLVQIDLRSSVPIYQQLKTALIAGILSGELQEGDRLPSVRDLAGDLGINLHTVRKVYGLLVDDGYVDMSRNQGALVAAPPSIDKEAVSQFERVLLPIIIELRARNISKEKYDALMNHLWEVSLTKGVSHE
jgi:DNA-binding transcriptional regulator YhcF (GntR family)